MNTWFNAWFNAWFNTLFIGAPEVTLAMYINTDLSCSQSMDADMASSHSSGPDIIIAPGSSCGHPDLYGGMTLELQLGLRYWFRPWASAQSLVVIGVTDINRDSGCSRAMDLLRFLSAINPIRPGEG